MVQPNKTILIVDNSPVIIERMVMFIQNLPNIKYVLPALDLNAAEELLKTREIHIAIIDIHLDNSTGLELLPLIKNNYPGIATIMFTNQPIESYEILSQQLGATHFLDKSKDFTKLPGIIASLV